MAELNTLDLKRIVVWDRDVLPESTSEQQQIDITDPASYKESLREVQPTWLIHLAALSSVAESLTNEQQAHDTNVTATQQLFETLQTVSPDTHVLVASTADIYGAGSPSPIAELPLAQAMPTSPYAKSKWEMEKMIEEKYATRTILVRPFPHIGPGQRKGFVTADFASQIAAIEKGKQDSVLKVGNLEAVRDFTDVRNVVQAYRLLLEKGQLGEVYHVASGVGTSIQKILELLLSESKVPIAVEQDPDKMRPSDIPILVGDSSKLRAATQWAPTIPLSTTLHDILEWWRHAHSVTV